MNLYLITQKTDREFDYYAGAVVVAETEEEARLMHPGIYPRDEWLKWAGSELSWMLDSWTTPDKVIVRCLGVSDSSVKAGVVLSDYRSAG